MEIVLKNQQQKWDGNGEKRELEDYNEKEEKWKLELNKFQTHVKFYI